MASKKEISSGQREDFKQSLKEKFDGNAEVQRWRTQMTPEERSRDAIERVAKNLHEYNQIKAGRDTPYEEARRQAEDLAYKHDRNKK